MAFRKLYPKLPERNTPLWLKITLIGLASLIVILAVAFITARTMYLNRLKPLGSGTQKIEVVIEPGTTAEQIAMELEQKQVIQSAWAFDWYVRFHGLRSSLKAGTYEFSSAQSVIEIAAYLDEGKVATKLITIIPGKRLDEIKQAFVKAGYTDSEIEEAFLPATYPGHPALKEKPTTASLEGYIYPETFQGTSQTKASEIVKNALDELEKELTPDIKTGIAAQGLTLHQGIILASIVEKEVSNSDDKAQVAQVLILRFKRGIRLESDPTAHYGALVNGAEPSVKYDSPYNTYLYSGLPPGPISNFSATSLKAVANPAKTDWLFFVSGDDGRTHFSRTLSEHQALTRKYCTKACQ